MPSHDVLIIGAGLAGQRAALAAAQAGATVAIVSKVHPVRSHSVAAAGGINAALNPEDTWESHAFDTVKGSDYLGDQDAIEIMCREAPDEILWLEHAGVTFHRNETGHLGTRAFGGASAARTYYVADITGHAILHVLYEQLMKHNTPVDRYEEWFTTDLLQDDERPLRRRDLPQPARRRTWRCSTPRPSILASGGAGQAYKPTTNGLIVTGDGIAQAYRIGARADGHGDDPVPPDDARRQRAADHRGRSRRGRLAAERQGRAVHGELRARTSSSSPRATSSRAPSRPRSTRAAASPTGRSRSTSPRSRGGARSRHCARSSTSAATSPASTSPASRSTSSPGQHYIMGGVKTDSDGQTTIPGLYAAGEVACVSVHGGNRLGANSLLDTLIFGRRCGRARRQPGAPDADAEDARRRA